MAKSKYALESAPKKGKGIKFALYGVEGIGKSTLASKLPSPIFIDTEGSTDHMTVCRYPRPLDWDDLMGMVEDASRLKTRTLVIDTLDWADILCTRSLCREKKWKSIEDAGYGKGYIMLGEKFAALLDKLSQMADAGVNVGFTAHAQLRKVEKPEETGAYDHWEMKCSKRVAPLVKEWCDLLLFLNYDSVVVHGSTPMESNRITGNKRVMYANHQPTFDAKNRFGLPDKMELSYDPLREIFERAEPVQAEPEPKKRPKTDPPAPMAADKTDEDPFCDSSAGGDPEPEAPKPAAEWTEKDKEELRPTELKDRFPELEALMKRDGISYSTVQWAVARKGHKPPDLPVELYDNEYVDRLVRGWDKFVEYIKKNS